MKKEKKYSDSEVATQRNDLIHGKQELSLIQKRIFALTVQQIHRDDEDYKTYSINVRDLVDAGTSKSVFGRLEEETKKLMAKVLTKREKENGNDSFTHWSMISKAKHVSGEGQLNIDLHPDIRDMLLELKEQGNFTPVPVAEMLACQSMYGQRIYELLYSERWKETGTWETSLKNLRFILGIEDKYSNFSDFRRWVLKKAQKDLQKNTNMRISWEEERRARGRGTGRKVTHIIFSFSFKRDQIDLALETPDKFDYYNLRSRLQEYAKLTGRETDKIMNWLEVKSKDQQKKFAINYNKNFENVIDSGSTVAGGKRIEKPKGYFMANYKSWLPPK